MRKVTSINIDQEILEKFKTQGINLSELVNTMLHRMIDYLETHHIDMPDLVQRVVENTLKTS